MTASPLDKLTATEMPTRTRKHIPDFRPYVTRGAALLDVRVPGWAGAVDVDLLKLSSTTQCVVGQLAIKAMLNGPLNGYHPGVTKLFRGARNKERASCEHGFNLPGTFERWAETQLGGVYGTIDHTHWAFDELTRLWIIEINKRLRKAAKTKAPVAQA